MLRRSCFQLVSLPWSEMSEMSVSLVPRASIHTCGVHLAKKKKTDPPAAPAKKDTTASQKPDSSSGTEYSSGEVFFGHNPYSFYDIENDMAPHRIVQPSSLKTQSAS